MFQRLFGRERSANRAITDALYEQIVAAARQPPFYSDWNVPDTPLGRFEMLSLHMFLFQHRLRGEARRLARGRADPDRRVLHRCRAFAARARHRRSRRAEAHEEAGAHVLWPRRGLWRGARARRPRGACRGACAQRPARCGRLAGSRASLPAMCSRPTACWRGSRRTTSARGSDRLSGRRGRVERRLRCDRTNERKPGFLRGQCRAAAAEGHAGGHRGRRRGSARRWPPSMACVSVERLRAELLVAPWKRNGVKVSGEVEADITQACVVTLEPIEAHDQRRGVEGLFLPEDSKLGRLGFDGGGEVHARRRRARQPGNLFRRHDRCRRAGRGVLRPGHRSLSAQAGRCRCDRAGDDATSGADRRAAAGKAALADAEILKSAAGSRNRGCAAAQNRYFRPELRQAAFAGETRDDCRVIRISIDAMGGDHGPAVVIPGAA